MAAIGWLVTVGIILYFSFKLFDQVKSYLIGLEVRIDLLEEHARVLEMNNEDCEKMINTLSQRVKELEEELNI
ncbi:hypothetical protein ACJOYH_05890 [Acinetobacter baumannii]